LLVVPTAMGAIAGTAGITAIFVVVAITLVAGAVVALATSFDDDTADRSTPAPSEPALPAPSDTAL
jgi:hypothetical protein